ncbi:MAG: hypothetical protein K8H86_12035 [Ignavibacteriaceae bacterium]|nr:hypothetical protein [Ignavibacteriaceae bacterium]
MKKNSVLTFLLLILFTHGAFSQPITERYKQLGEMFVSEFSTAPFPDSERTDGHVYNNQTFSFQEHYNDSSVAVFIPEGFKASNETNFVVYFHGWYNNIDSASAQYKLIEQFSGSNKNAVFVFPEGPKNAPDSYGGKLEGKDGLKRLLNDVINFLINKGKLKSSKVGSIILAGHSGAYRVISFCLMRGGLTKNISDVILFDALYGETEKYSHWIENYTGRFINIYTDGGGTRNKTESLMDDLDAWGIPYFKSEENKLKESDLTDNRLIFIHTDLTHNQVIAERNQLMNYLKTSMLSTITR